MTWPLAAVIIVAIICTTIAIIAPLFITWRHAPVARTDTHQLDPGDAATRVDWPQREMTQ